MEMKARELARHLAAEAEAVCRYYLSNGRRSGRYWTVGDVRNAPGRSLFVRLDGPLAGPSAAGKWSDAATGEHGDLLDIIGMRCGFTDFRAVMAEASRFLRGAHHVASTPAGAPITHSGTAARRLFAMSQPIGGTLVETYLRHRAISLLTDCDALRFHPRCYYRADQDAAPEFWPAMIAAVTTIDGRLTGVHRTWLAPSGLGKASIATPRRSMGRLLGQAVRFGGTGEVLAAGEGLETMLSLRSVLPLMPVAAALSAHHLAALLLPATMRRLYIAADADPAGTMATMRLAARVRAAGMEAIPLSPRLGDFNDDLIAFGLDGLRATLHLQLAPEDRDRFLVEAKAARR